MWQRHYLQVKQIFKLLCQPVVFSLQWNTQGQPCAGPTTIHVSHTWLLRMSPAGSTSWDKPQDLRVTHLGCRCDDGLQCCWWTRVVAGITARVLGAVVMVVVAVGGRVLQQFFPSRRGLCLGVKGGGGGGERSWRWRRGRRGTQDRGHSAQKPESGLNLWNFTCHLWCILLFLHYQKLFWGISEANLGSQRSEVTGYEGEVRYPWKSYPGLLI